MNTETKSKKKKVLTALLSISFLVISVFYGLIVRPLILGQPSLPLEIVFLSAASLLVFQLLCISISWNSIQQAIVNKLGQALPTILLLFAIGLLIGSWIMAGTIPMLVYFALQALSVEHFYLLCFVIPILFSICTGTSWGSIATIGLVLIAVATVYQADVAIAAGAIIGGAYFGDKLSPLSDTTNIAAMSSGVELYQHIQSMLVTTLPSAVIAAIGFGLCDLSYPVNNAVAIELIETQLLSNTLVHIEQLFSFNLLLLLPVMIILFGSLMRMPPLPILILSSFSASLLAFIVQNLNITDIAQTLYQGFNVSMLASGEPLPQNIGQLFNRGGLYALSSAIMITILVFVYVGALDCISAFPTLMGSLLTRINSARVLISSTLLASAFTNAMTSSQYANSFIVAESFKNKYDALQVDRKVLSRSLEDSGTMIESLVPWSTTAVFIYATLDVSITDYWHWQLLSLINIPLAFMLVFFNKGFSQSSSNSNKYAQLKEEHA